MLTNPHSLWDTFLRGSYGRIWKVHFLYGKMHFISKLPSKPRFYMGSPLTGRKRLSQIFDTPTQNFLSISPDSPYDRTVFGGRPEAVLGPDN